MPEPPGEEIPEDPAEKPGEDDRGRDRLGVHDVLCDRGGHLQGDKGADEVEEGGEPDGDLRLQAPVAIEVAMALAVS